MASTPPITPPVVTALPAEDAAEERCGIPAPGDSMEGDSVGSNSVREEDSVAIAVGCGEASVIDDEASSVGDNVLSTGLLVFPLLSPDPRSVGLGVVDVGGDTEGHSEKLVQTPCASFARHV